MSESLLERGLHSVATGHHHGIATESIAQCDADRALALSAKDSTGHLQV
ncbi:hypothetical protein [Caulifigura coniformis]|nr:hypothetical protein [Caulifigura coniformis]